MKRPSFRRAPARRSRAISLPIGRAHGFFLAVGVLVIDLVQARLGVRDDELRDEIGNRRPERAVRIVRLQS